MLWIPINTTLSGVSVSLIPLTPSHFQELNEVGSDLRIWEFYAIGMLNSSDRLAAFEEALQSRDNGAEFPFVIIDRSSEKIIGSTRFLNIDPVGRKLEIGWTWLHPDYWHTRANIECKVLLLEFCFQELKAIRVQLKTDEKNIRSRKAIEKIGARFEGVLRNDMIRADGTFRNSAYFSIIESDWKEAQPLLSALLLR